MYPLFQLFLFQLLRGLHYCHNRKVLHRYFLARILQSCYVAVVFKAVHKMEIQEYHAFELGTEMKEKQRGSFIFISIYSSNSLLRNRLSECHATLYGMSRNTFRDVTQRSLLYSSNA